MQQCRVGEALGSILNLVPNGRDKDCVYMSLCVCMHCVFFYICVHLCAPVSIVCMFT